jgi:hypothetical protein
LRISIVFSIISFSFLSLFTFGQRKNTEFKYYIKKLNTSIKVDGQEEQAWSSCAVASDFHMVLPMDTSKAMVRTDVKMAYDNDHLYILAVCYKSICVV